MKIFWYGIGILLAIFVMIMLFAVLSGILAVPTAAIIWGIAKIFHISLFGWTFLELLFYCWLTWLLTTILTAEIRE